MPSNLPPSDEPYSKEHTISIFSWIKYPRALTMCSVQKYLVTNSLGISQLMSCSQGSVTPHTSQAVKYNIVISLGWLRVAIFLFELIRIQLQCFFNLTNCNKEVFYTKVHNLKSQYLESLHGLSLLTNASHQTWV